MLSHNGRMVGKRLPTKDRFAEKFQRGADDQCWPWTAGTNGAGYGMLWSPEAGRKVLAHRYSFEIHYGPLNADDLVLHSCDNRACVNPAHLRAGSHKENVSDMDSRGRRVSNARKGETNCNARMTADAVIRLRQRYIAGDALADLVRDFGCTENALTDYTSGRSWRHLLGANGCPTLEQLKAECARRRRSGSKISEEDARDIRAALASGETGRSIAARYGIHTATVSDIKHGRIWPVEA